MGRIPLFVNTDCLLPLDIDEEWKKHVVLIEKDSLNDMVKTLEIYHSNFSNKTLNEFFESNRNFWLEKLTLNGYFINLFSNI